MDQKRPVFSSVKITARRKKLFKPLLQAPIVAFIFMLHATASAFTYNDADFDLNKLMMIITPDYFPIIWKHAQKYPINYSDTSGMSSCVGDSGPPTNDLIYRCPAAVIGMGGTTGYKIFRDVPGYGIVEVYYKLNGSVWEVVGTVANLDGDLQGDNTDPDIDGDGINNSQDDAPRDPDLWDTETQDTDNDGIPDAFDAYPFDASRNTDIVGKMPDEFSVSASGAATYTIPLQLPPGRGGLKPELALEYDSQAGNGLLGIGWSLSGLSAITRCSATLVPDGKFDPVDFDSNDKYCLGGQKLIEINTGSDNYGSYKEYRTEIDSFSRIRSYGVAGSGPAAFRVWTRSGQLMEYGVESSIDDVLSSGTRSPASRVEAQDRLDVLVWAVNKVRDSSNNYFTISYQEDNDNGQHYPLSVHYTGNSDLVVPTHSFIRFRYESRPDNSMSYVGGALSRTLLRMSGIDIYAGSVSVKKYNLIYKTAGIVSKSILSNILECDQANRCRPGPEFQWKITGDGAFTQLASNTNLFINNSTEAAKKDLSRMSFGDFDGDGKADIYYLNSASAQRGTVFHSNGNGTFSSALFGPSALPWAGERAQKGFLQFGDFDSDARTDLYMIHYGSDGVFQGNNAIFSLNMFGSPSSFGPSGMYYSDAFLNSGAYVPQQDVEDSITDAVRIKLGDFNGDGKTDVYQVRGGNSQPEPGRVYLRDGSTTTQAPSFSISGSSNERARFDIGRILLGDFNGDGMTDIFYVNGWSGNANASVYLSNGDGSFASTGNNGPNIHIGNNVNRALTDIDRIKFGDFNGDGMTDVLLVNSHNNSVSSYIYFSKGNGSFEPKTTGPESYVGDSIDEAEEDLPRIKIGDFNADGMSDVYIVMGRGNSAPAQVHFSKGDGTFVPMSTGPGTSVGGTNSAAKIDIARIHIEDFDGDGASDVHYAGGWGDGGTNYVYFSNSEKIVLEKIGKTGEGQLSISYTPSTDEVVHTNGFTDAMRDPIPLVKRVTVDNGIGGLAAKNYNYSGMDINPSRRHMLGFASMSVTDEQTGIKTSSTFLQSFPYTGMVSGGSKSVGAKTISSVQYTYHGTSPNCAPPAAAGVHLALPCTIVEKAYDFDSGSLLSTVTTTTTYGANGNAANIEVKTKDEAAGDIYTTTTANQYAEDDIDSWHLGRLTRSTVTKTAPNNSPSERTSAFNYDSSTGMLIREVIEPDNGANIRLTTHYKRDGFGNITHTTLCEGSIQPSNCHENTSVPPTGSGVRRTITSYESGLDYPAGLFPTKVKNALNHEETRVYDARFGLVKSVTGPNGLTTTSQYDSFGRKILEQRADNTQTSISYAFCSPSCPTVIGPTAVGVTAKYQVTTASTGSAPLTVYFDAFDRETRRSSPGFGSPSVSNDDLIYVDTQYDGRGRTLYVSEPYFAGTASVWTEYGYDDINRVIVLNQPHTSTNVLTDYNGLTTVVTDVMGRNKIETKNAIGQTTFVTEADNTADEVTTEYRYDAAGNLKETQIAGHAASLVRIFYDDRGRKEELRDPDMGTWHYVYNSFGELVSQTDALGQTTIMEYNKIGQLAKRIDRFGSSSERISEWSFGNSQSAHNIGKPETITVTDPNPDADSSTADPASNSTRSFLYDSVGRLYRTTDTIAGQTFVTEQSYDGAGRPDTLTYPTTTQYSAGFKVKRIYKSNGYLEKVQTPDASKVFWRADEVNARGQLVAHTLGNGIDTTRVYDSATGWMQGIMTEDTASNVVQHMSYGYFANGSLEHRADYRQGGLSENFTYDNLNRLSTSQVSGQALKTYNYDPLGNITFKTGVGHYKYGADCVVPAGLHAVCEIRSAASSGALLKSYEYNDNGNASLSAGREVDYTGFNKPMRFTEGSTVLSFVYGADLNRIFQETVAPGKHSKTYYVGLGDSGGALFEREVDLTANPNLGENRHYIYADSNSPVAMHVVKDNGTTTLNVSNRYFHHDHLGSVEAITDDTGLASSAVYMSYDSWGLRRNPDWSDATGSLAYVDGVRGFTGQEDLPEIDLIHMNGRVYDPVLGRFQSADPYMQPVEFSQGMNRYGYVLNNPLTNFDPTGYKSIFRRAKESIEREWKEFWKRDLKPFLNRLTRHCSSCGAGYDSDQGWHTGAESSPYGTYRNNDLIPVSIGSAVESAVPLNSIDPATATRIALALIAEGRLSFANGSETVTQEITMQGTENSQTTSTDAAKSDEMQNYMPPNVVPPNAPLNGVNGPLDFINGVNALVGNFNNLTWTHTWRGICDGQGPQCGQAMKAAGISEPYYGPTKTYNVKCILTGVGTNITGAAMQGSILKGAPTVLNDFGYERLAKFVGGAASILNHPVVEIMQQVVGVDQVLKKCECEK